MTATTGTSQPVGKGSKEQHAPARPKASLGPLLPLSLLAGGLASYPSLSSAATGEGDLLHAATLFLIATLAALVGLGVVAVVIRSVPAPHPEPAGGAGGGEDGRGDGGGSLPPPAIAREIEGQSDDIDQALAPTDALVHQDPGPG